MATTMGNTLYGFTSLPLKFHIWPTFPFNRILYFTTYECAYQSCYKNFWGVPEEIHTCIITIFLSSIFYLVLALYLQNVVP